jgi:hypothetical protein
MPQHEGFHRGVINMSTTCFARVELWFVMHALATSVLELTRTGLSRARAERHVTDALSKIRRRARSPCLPPATRLASTSSLFFRSSTLFF